MSRASAFFFAAILVLALACLPTAGDSESAEGTVQAGNQSAAALEGDYLYRVVTLRAAPGRLLDLIELLEEERDLMADVEEPLPFWMRHTQGDQWDLMVLYPMGSFHEYYEPERLARRLSSGVLKGLSEEQLLFEASRITSWKDEVFVRGPGPEILSEAFGAHGFYHVEMFVALPGRHRDLLEERRM